MTLLVQRIRPNRQVPRFFSASSRFALSQILACGLFVAIGVAADYGKPHASSESVAADNLAVAEQLKDVFDAGFRVGPRSAQEAQERLARVRRLAPGEPRIDYSHGLVLVRQSQIKLAIVQFEAAVAQEGPPLWPAWKAAIWSQLIEKRYEPGLNRLVEFAILVRQANAAGGAFAEGSGDDESEFTETQREAARWIGQLLEALDQLPDARKHKALIEERQSRVFDALGEDLSSSVDEGRELLRARAFEWGMAADAARDTAEQMARRRKLDRELEAIMKGKGNSPQTKEEWKKWIDDVLAQFDKQLQLLDRGFQTLTQRSDALQQSYVQAASLLTATKGRMSMMHHTSGPLGMGILKEQMVAYNDQMVAYQVEYNFVVEQAFAVAQSAAKIGDHRIGAIARYEKATGDTIPKNPDLDKWATRLNVKRPKLTTKTAAKPARKDAADRKRPPTLKSLMPLDLEHERDEVLASFGLRASTSAGVVDSDEQSEAKSDKKTATPAQK